LENAGAILSFFFRSFSLLKKKLNAGAVIDIPELQ
jgi:hypothetical protein